MGSYAKRGDPPLSVIVHDASGESSQTGTLNLTGSEAGYSGTDINELDPASSHTLDTETGQSSRRDELQLRATAAGANGVYSYSWAIAEQEDVTGIGGAGCAVLSAGTTNQLNYNDFTFRITQPALIDPSTGMPINPPPQFIRAVYSITCTVTSTQDGITVQQQDSYTLTIKRPE